LNDGANPANGSYDLQFGLWSAASGPSQLGSVLTSLATPVSNGLFTVTMDFGNQFPGAPRWLEIGVRTNGGGAYSALLPRQALPPTPYALYSPTAGSANSVAAANITGTISSNNIGAGSITTAMLANGAVGSNQLASGAVTAGALADGAVTASKVASLSALLTTFTNPAPAASDIFGWSVAAVGTDRVLIGAYQDNGGVGAAYLFSTNATLITTYVNPTPTALADELFGNAVAALGTDRVVIGELHGGGNDAIGRVHLYSTNGTLLTTFNPPGGIFNYANFGYAVAVVGTDRVLIGAEGPGKAYLYNTNGALLTTFTGGGHFGGAVAALGSDRVLIGAYGDDTGANDAGSASLFSTNGTLLKTFNNPSLAAADLFGWSVAAVGTDRVLIGAQNDNTGIGVAYLFSTNGTLLRTFNNPSPEAGDDFGVSVAALGTNRVLIGANSDSTGANDAGVGYLFSTEIEPYTPGLIAAGVSSGSITTASLQDGAVTAAMIGGTLNDSSLSANVALLNRPVQSFTGGTNSFSGNVGIGTATPGHRLEINGNALVKGTDGFDAPGEQAAFIMGDPNHMIAAEYGFGLRLSTYGASSGLVLRESTGNVGIGTANPAVSLDIYKYYAAGLMRFGSATTIARIISRVSSPTWPLVVQSVTNSGL
jgi:hypothetical protein